jgi:hypothetical protein
MSAALLRSQALDDACRTSNTGRNIFLLQLPQVAKQARERFFDRDLASSEEGVKMRTYTSLSIKPTVARA